MKSIIEARDIYKVYTMGEEKIYALRNINLDIYYRETITLVGTSGSGKSTLLNLLAGLEKPSKGIVKIGGITISSLKEEQVTKFRQLNIGFIFQSFNLINTLTALENVEFSLMLKGVNKKDRIERSKKILNDVGLGNRFNHRPNEMSGGQQQRVSIARALVDNPKIVFADEPTGNLDSKTSMDILNLILRLTKEHKQTVIMVTHDNNIAKYGDRTIYLKDGSIRKIEELNYEKIFRIIFVFILIFNLASVGVITKADEIIKDLNIEEVNISNQNDLKPKDNFKIEFKVNNISDDIIKNIKFSLGKDNIDNFTIINDDDLSIDNFEAQQSKSMILNLVADEKIQNGPYNIDIVVNYEVNDEEKTQIFYFRVNVNNDKLEQEKNEDENNGNNEVIQLSGGSSLPPLDSDGDNSSGGAGSSTISGGKPKLIVDNYSVTPNPISAGEEFDLTISFYNTNKKKSVSNIKIMLNSSGSSIDSGGINATEGNAPSVTGSIFIPLGSSNTFFIDSIGAGRRITKTIRLTTPYGVSPNIYELNVNLEYEDSQGNEFESMESLGINLFQEAKVQIGTISFGDPSLGGIMVGEDTSFSVDLYNTGRSPIYNLMIKATGDFEIEGDTLYIGTFQPGSTESFSSNIRVLNEGEVKGNLLITYEDSTGQSHELNQEFSGTAMGMESDIDMDFPIEEDSGYTVSNNIKIIIGILILILLIVLSIIILKKKRKRKNDNLSIEDELNIKLEEENTKTNIEINEEGNKDEDN